MKNTILEQYAKGKGFSNVADTKPLKVEILKRGCRWLVNGKKTEDCSDWEKDFMNRFFQEVKVENLHK